MSGKHRLVVKAAVNLNFFNLRVKSQLDMILLPGDRSRVLVR